MLVKKYFLVGIFTLLSVSLAVSAQPVHPTTGEPLMIDCLRGTVTIDGDLSDWNLEAMTPAVLDAVEQLSSGQDVWDNVGDCSGEFYMLWDDVNIYMAVVVKDDKLSMNKMDASIWNSDCVEILFATTDSEATHSWTNPTIHYQYGFNADNQKWIWCSMDGPGQSEPDYLQIASSVTADGYVLEASIEYAQMSALDFSAGNTIGIHPCIDDTDIENGDTEYQMSWTGLPAHDQSLGFGHMVLSADSVPEPEDPNPVGWWPLNEGSGDIATDVSGRGNDGTINNADTGGLGDGGSVWVDDPERGVVLSFNGDDGTGAVVGTDLIIPALTMDNDFTWAFWCFQHPDQETNNDTILGNRYGGTQSPLQFCKFTPTRFEFYNDDGNYEQGINYDPVPGGVWTHHVISKDGADLTYYRNGVESGTNTITKTMDENPFGFGGDFINNNEKWQGYLSDVRLYNRALTKLEVLAVVKGVEQIDMEIGYAIKAPVLDGEYDGIWAAASTQSFVPLDDPADGSGTWKVLYDAENLYVLVDMTDDSLQNDSSSSWQDDSVEIYFDGGNTKLSTPLSGDDHQYTFGWTTDDIQGTNISGYTDGIEHAQVTTDTGWRIEVKMPWQSIWGVEPQAGDLVGIDCYYNDDDDGGDSREGKMLSFSAIEGWNDASQWATAVLGIAPEPVDPGTDGLVAYYALENNTDDSSGNGLNGTIVGAPVYVEGPAGYGTAMEFDGESYVDCGFDPRLDITGPISMSIWIKPGTDGSVETAPLSKADSVRGWSWQLRYGWNTDKPTIMGFQFNGTDNRVWIYVNQELAVGQWYHIAGAYDGETVRCYLDGLETDSAPMSGITGGPSSLLVGSDGWRCDWIGAIDEVAIYDRGLSAEEVLYLAGFGVTVENLALNPSFEEDDVVLDDPDWYKWCTWNDAAGAGSNATIVDTDAVDGAKSLRVEPIGIENWHFIVANISFPLSSGADFTATFWAKAEADRPLGAQMKAADNSVSWGYADFQLTTDWAEYTMTSTAESDEGKLEFFCAGSEIPFLLDLVSVFAAE